MQLRARNCELYIVSSIQIFAARDSYSNHIFRICIIMCVTHTHTQLVCISRSVDIDIECELIRNSISEMHLNRAQNTKDFTCD